MPKIKFKCAGCGKEFEDWVCNRPFANVYCSRECAGTAMESDTIVVSGRHRVHVDHAACYREEARAILAGTKKGINRCQKLIGDD
jgi:DNA-directed RNA polymerase subunit RPC12/RpoP